MFCSYYSSYSNDNILSSQCLIILFQLNLLAIKIAPLEVFASKSSSLIIRSIVLVISVLLQKSEGGALGLGVSQDNFTSARSVGNFLTKFTSVIATLFIICSLAIVAISRDELRETQSVLEKQEEEDSSLPQIPQSK